MHFSKLHNNNKVVLLNELEKTNAILLHKKYDKNATFTRGSDIRRPIRVALNILIAI